MLIERIYAATLDPSNWQAVLDELCAATGANGGIIRSHDISANEGGLWVGRNIDPAAIPAYVQHDQKASLWHLSYGVRPDRWTNAGPTSEAVVDRSRFVASAWGNDVLRPMDFVHFCGTLPRDGNSGLPRTMVSLFRLPNVEDFGAGDIRLMEALLPHFRRAFELHWRLRDRGAPGAAALEALDRLRVALFLVDPQRRVMHHNRAARAMIAARDGLAIQAGRLQTTIAGEALDAMLQRAMQPARQRGENAASASLAVRRPSGRPAYVATILSGRDAPGLNGGHAAALVFVADPSARPRLLSPALARVFGISPAEARLVNVLVAAESLKQAAAAIGISLNTARSQIKSVLEKTGSSRQVDLVATLLQATAHLPDD